MKVWLVQRGKFKKVARDRIEGLDSLISLDCMVSPEFNKGALQQSLQRMLEGRDRYAMHRVEHIKTNYGESLYLYCDTAKLEEVKAGAIQLSKNKYCCKEVCDIFDFMAVNGIPSRMLNDFWWDIENDFFIVFGSERAEKLQLAMDNMGVNGLQTKKVALANVWKRILGGQK